MNSAPLAAETAGSPAMGTPGYPWRLAGTFWLSVAEAADYLHVHPKTIRRAYLGGALPVHRVGRSVRINLEDLLRWTASSSRV